MTALRSLLLSRLQTVLGPLWVWLAFGELPAATTLVGGSIVLASTVAASLLGQHSEGGAGRAKCEQQKERDGATKSEK